ncbi:MAG TPA: SpoIIE family protein phosphatase [Solirubrobacteraceae bacterium]|nr:SpoIIE family protein phosphatase [Solirubrobacteraceae bacterium]
MRRHGIAALVTWGVLLVPAASLAASVPTISVPTVSVPTVSVPTVSVSTVSVPTVTVPAVTVPSVTTPPVTVGTVPIPQVSTPTVSTPGITTPSASPLPTPVRQTPTGDTQHSNASASGTPGTTSQGAASQSAPSRASGGRSAAGTGRGSGPSGGRAGHAGAGPTTGTAGGAGGRRSATTGLAAGGAAGNASRNGPIALAPQGSRRGTDAAASKPNNGPFVKLVKVLPTAMLIALLAFGVVAAAMALNAYLQRRRARSLAGQREALLSDVGVLQAALLPAVPESLGELSVSVAYRPAQGLAAGGDFFDVFTISPETTGIIIGDVSGHGRESLIQAALVRYTLRTLMGEGHQLPEVLARADRYLTGELGDGFATVVICRYEHPAGELTWAKAGHEPPIIVGQPEADEAGASPLGFGFGDGWPQFSRALAPGERMCLFTDGLIEARRADGEQLGRAHLRALVEQGMSAQELVAQIQADADECPDDLAAVVISRAPAVETPPATETDTRQPATV